MKSIIIFFYIISFLKLAQADSNKFDVLSHLLSQHSSNPNIQLYFEKKDKNKILIKNSNQFIFQLTKEEFFRFSLNKLEPQDASRLFEILFKTYLKNPNIEINDLIIEFFQKSQLSIEHLSSLNYYAHRMLPQYSPQMLKFNYNYIVSKSVSNYKNKLVNEETINHLESTPQNRDLFNFNQKFVGNVKNEDPVNSPSAISSLPHKSQILMSNNDYHLVQVYYGTNRNIKTTQLDKPYSEWYGQKRDFKINFGTATVSIPKSHQHGHLERPLIESISILESDKRHITIKGLLSQDERSFFDQINQALVKAEEKSALIFLHGYNVSFSNSTFRAAQIYYDLTFKGVPIMYSWPSNGSLEAYVSDTNDARNSAKFIKLFLKKIIKYTSFQKIHIIAHSMGNLATNIALSDFSKEFRGLKKPFENFVLAAPDVDLQEFQDRMYPHLDKIINQVTLYTSKTDLAIHGSKAINDYPRLGGHKASILAQTFQNIHVIDATQSNMGLFNYLDLNHSYYGESKMLYDLEGVINGVSPSQRQLKERTATRSIFFWELD